MQPVAHRTQLDIDFTDVNLLKSQILKNFSLCPSNIGYSALICLREQLRELYCMVAVDLRDKRDLYD